MLSTLGTEDPRFKEMTVGLLMGIAGVNVSDVIKQEDNYTIYRDDAQGVTGDVEYLKMRGTTVRRLLVYHAEPACEYSGERISGGPVSDLSGSHRHYFRRSAHMAVLPQDHPAGHGAGKAVPGDGEPEL